MRFVIESHEPLTQNVYHIRLSGDTRAIVRPGQFVQVELPLGMATGALTVPTRAVQPDRDESYVYVVDKDSRASYRKVRPLFEHSDRTVVDGNVAEGDKIVVDGQVRLAPGLLVKIMD